MSEGDQLPLGLPLEARLGIDDLVVSHVNRDAVTFLESWPDWPVQIVILAGPVGVGKSHLASIWANKANAVSLPPSGDLTPQSQSNANVVVEEIRLDPIRALVRRKVFEHLPSAGLDESVLGGLA